VTLGNDKRTDGQTDGQTDRQTDRVRRIMRPPPREEGRITNQYEKFRPGVLSIIQNTAETVFYTVQSYVKFISMLVRCCHLSMELQVRLDVTCP